MFKYSLDNKRYYTLNYYYKKKYGCKVFKVSLNAGFTCPNIDGTKGTGGCSYCLNGSGEKVKTDNLVDQFNNIKEIQSFLYWNMETIFKQILILMPLFLN